MNPPPGTSWKDWVAVCPRCAEGFPCSDGPEFEGILASHWCLLPPFEGTGLEAS